METAILASAEDKAAAEAGDFEAMARLYRAKIFRFALAWLRDSDAADTIAQDCFLKAYKNWSGFRRQCSLETWLMQIAVNLLRDYRRNRRLRFWKWIKERGEPVEAAENRRSGGTPEARILAAEKVQAVWRAAEKLPEKQRRVFLLRFVEDMDLLEIAAVTGLKEGTVKAHLFSALRNVRKQMGASI